MSQSKTCTKCGQTKSSSEFSKNPRAKSGLHYYCKSCVRAAHKLYRQNNKEKLAESKAAYHNKNSDRINEKVKAWRAQNPERYKKQNQSYYLANAERIKARTSDYAKRNKAQVAATKAAKYIEQRDQIKARASQWQKENPEARRLQRITRRARLRANSIFRVTKKEIDFLMRNPCLYCGDKAKHIDHIIPLARGGRHSIGNLAPACAKCNLSKNMRFIMEWKLIKMTAEKKEKQCLDTFTNAVSATPEP